MYKKKSSNWVKHLDFIILDILCLEIALCVGFWHRLGPLMIMRGVFRELIVVVALAAIIVGGVRKSYHGILRRDNLDELLEVIKFTVSCLIVSLLYMFVSGNFKYCSRIAFVMLWVVGPILMFVFRCLLKKLLRHFGIRSDQQSNLLVVTTEDLAEDVVRKLEQNPMSDLKVVGLVFLTNPPSYEAMGAIPVLSGVERTLEYARTHVVDAVLISVNGMDEEVRQVANTLIDMGITVHINLTQFADSYPNQMVENIGNMTVLSTSLAMTSGWQLFLKRLLDICGSLVGLILTGIAFVIFAPIIYKQSPGPIFFSQTRVGRNGRTFKIYKFRSMYLDAEERKKELMEQNKMSGFMFKMDNDPRIIPIGHFIRKMSIDELPQFWNIFKGDMSLVGTRPPTLEEYKQYELHHKVRLSAKPGLTGLWQTSGRSDITDFEEVVALDAQYIANWNIWLDIKLILKTIVVVLKREGSE